MRVPEVQFVERIQEQTVETKKWNPKECVRQRTVEQIGNVLVPQFREQIAEVVTVILRRTHFLVCEL